MIISWENNKSGREVDLPCKNKWNWSWLEEKDVNVDFILDYIRKIDASGLASCIYFNKPVSYVRSCKKDKTKSMMPKCHLIISTIKKIIVKLIVYLVLRVNYPHYLNQVNVHQSQKSLICHTESLKMFTYFQIVLLCKIKVIQL